MTPASHPARRLALAAGLFTAALISCGRDVTGPVSAPVNAFKRFAAFAFEPQYTTTLTSSALHAALTQVAFEKVRITLRREDGTIALDTVVNFPAGADSLTLSLVVALAANAPPTGVPFSLNLGYVNAAGDTVFRGGPSPVTVVPSTAGGAPPPPVQVPVHYTGTGSNATSVTISPRTAAGLAGQATTFSAVARATDGSAIAGTPVVFTSSDAGVVTVNTNSGAATFIGRGTAKVYAQLLTGPSDSATVTVTLPASRIELGSGAAQTASAGSTLPQPIVARVLAADGIGVGGVAVTFAVSAGGGSLTPASAVSAADGSVSTSWKLGGTAGAQTMTVTSAGLTGSPLTVSATALPVVASRLVITTGPVGGKAGAPIGAVVTAQDALGNTATSFNGDVSVAIGTNPGSATLGGTTTVKAVNGIATFSGLTLNRPGTGYTLLFSGASLAGAASAAFNILTGDAAKLVFGPMPAAADVGIAIAPPIQVFAQDSSGNTVTTFTGAVTVAFGANTGGGTLTGTLTRNAVAGVATFNDLVINRKGASYTLVASGTGLVSGTSAAFNMAPGVPTGISIVSGNGQTAAAGSALNAIIVRLHDALGNGISDVPIAFAVTGGGGSLSSASVITDADGRAIASWTIGSGPQTMTATYGSGPGTLTATITATSTTALLTWTGATSSAWGTASNWSPAIVPTAVDGITIPVTSTAPIITAPVSVFSLTVATGATLTNNSTLTINGSLDAGTTISGSGSVLLAGSSGTLKGVINQPVSVTGAAYTLNGTTQVTGPLTISASGKLEVANQALTVIGSLATSGSGRLAMTNTAGLVTVTVDANFAGGSESGYLTAGVLSVSGNFTATGSTFSASGSHTLKLAGGGVAQTLAFTSPLGGQGINHLTFENGATKTMSGAPQIMGDVSILATSAPVDGAVTVKIGGNFADATIFPDTSGYPNPLGGWRVANTNFFGSNKTINSVFITSNVTVSGTVQLAPCTSCLASLRAGLRSRVLASDGYVQVNGDVTASGAGAVLKLNGNELDVTGNFATASGGAVDLTNFMDYLYVYGSAAFGGGSTAGKLTLGTLEVVQDFTQSGAADSFAPGVDFYTFIGEYYASAALRSSRAVARSLGGAARTSPEAEAARDRRAQRFAPLRAARAERLAKLDRRAAAYAARGLAAPLRGQAATQSSPADGTALRLQRPARAYSGTSNISFTNSTSSFFGTLYLSGPTFILASDVLVAGRLETGYSSWHELYSSSATPRKVTSHGADVSQLGFDNTSWNLLDGSEIWYMEYVEFDNMDPTADQFSIARNGDDTPNCECSLGTSELYQWAFYTTPTTGHYIRVTDTNGPANVTRVFMHYPFPTTHGGKVAASPGPVTDQIMNWPATSVVAWTGASSTDWKSTLNWDGGFVPTATDDVLIPASASLNPRISHSAPDVITIGSTHHLTIEAGKSIDLGCSTELQVHGNVVAPLGAAAVQTCEGEAMNLIGDGALGGNTVVGKFDVVTVNGNYKVSGPGSQLIVMNDLTMDGTGNLAVNGGRVDANGLQTISDGTFTMTNALDQVYVGNYGAHFNGSSSPLTAGTLTITDGALSSSANYFAPSGTHKVVFAGTYASVSFGDPINSYFQDVTVNAGTTLSVNTNYAPDTTFGFNANGTLSRGAGSSPMAITSGDGRVHLNNVLGLNVTGGPTTFDNIGMRLFVGTPNATLNTVTFTNFPGYTGPILKVHRNSPEIITFNALDFSAVTGLGSGGRFLENSNTATVNIRGSTPGTGVLNTHYAITGLGSVSWIP